MGHIFYFLFGGEQENPILWENWVRQNKTKQPNKKAILNNAMFYRELKCTVYRIIDILFD